MVTLKSKMETHEATVNACRQCSPLGASLAFAGVAGALPYLHGGQGCATYIRRYTISHFREPVDIASSSFGETATVFGGKKNLFAGLCNVIRQYQPQMIGIASTCLSETIGEDVEAHLKEFRQANGPDIPELVFASTPSYAGSHFDGFHRAVYATVKTLAAGDGRHTGVNILPNMVTPADIRFLKELCEDFGLPATVLPDYSETLDGVSWKEYHNLPEGGTPLSAIREMGSAAATIEFSHFLEPEYSAGSFLARQFGVPVYRTGLPVGIKAGDELLGILEDFSGHKIPEKYIRERGRLLDSYVDAHKYVFMKKALVYGDPDFVVGLGAFLEEIGMETVLCAAERKCGLNEAALPFLKSTAERLIFEGADFASIAEIADQVKPDILIGSSKGYPLARRLKIPLVRLNFPVHDRMGASRLRCLGYSGTQELFDRIVNSLLEKQQDDSLTGFAYM